MNLSFVNFLFKIHTLFAILIIFSNLSEILSKNSVQMKNGVKSGKTSKTGKLSSKSKSGRKHTTISRKLNAPHGAEWHYGQNWRPDFEICGGSQQSPIRLITADAVRNMSLRFSLRNYNRPIRQAFIENNGHTVQIGFSDNFKASLYGSATRNRRFIFAQLHFHWGSYDGIGSEHTVDGIRGPMEMHMVHYNAKYGSLDNAADKSDGLMVLGTLFRSSSRNNRFMSSIIKLVRNVPNYEDESALLESFRLGDLLPRRKRPFFMYDGSLTTPPCYESVQWLVFKYPALIGDAQERLFRRTRGEYLNARTGKKRLLSNNYRPVQALNERQVIISS